MYGRCPLIVDLTFPTIPLCLGVSPTLDLPDQLSFGENPRGHAIVGIARAANRDVYPRTKDMEHHGDATHNPIVRFESCVAHSLGNIGDGDQSTIGGQRLTWEQNPAR